jgi:undecaprenyl-diphosphatase
MVDEASPSPPEPSRPVTDYERSPVDVLRLAIGAALLLVILILDWVFGQQLAISLGDVFAGLASLPVWVTDTLIVASRILAILLLVVGLAAVVIHRRWRLLLMALGAGLVALVIDLLLHRGIDEDPTAIVDVSVDLGAISSSWFPSAAGVAVIAAVATATAPWVPQNWRRAGWTLVVAATVAHFLVDQTSLGSAAALLSGWVAGSAALVLFGGPVRRPSDEAVAEGLASVGVPVAEIKKASVDARGSTPYFATTESGERLFAKALGADERSADLLFRAYRKLMPRDLGDERNFSSLRRTVEHEALVALTARDLGVRTPRFRAFGAVVPDAFVLAYEGIEGSSLDGVDPDKFDEELLAAVWGQVAILRHHRIAHRDLRLANVFRAADGEIWLIDFGFSELAASDLLLATDMAELVASTSLVVGPDRALAAGVAAVGPEAISTASLRLHPFALSGATRTGMKESPGLLDELRRRTEALAATPV